MSVAEKLPRSLQGHTGFLVTDVARLYRTILDRHMADFGLTRSQWWLMSHVLYFDGSTQQELANLMDTGKAGITKLIDKLEIKGLVKRVADPTDARQKRVYLSDRVKPLATEVDRELTKVTRTSLKGLNKDEVAQLNALLLHVRRNLVA